MSEASSPPAYVQGDYRLEEMEGNRTSRTGELRSTSRIDHSLSTRNRDQEVANTCTVTDNHNHEAAEPQLPAYPGIKTISPQEAAENLETTTVLVEGSNGRLRQRADNRNSPNDAYLAARSQVWAIKVSSLYMMMNFVILMWSKFTLDTCFANVEALDQARTAQSYITIQYHKTNIKSFPSYLGERRRYGDHDDDNDEDDDDDYRRKPYSIFYRHNGDQAPANRINEDGFFGTGYDGNSYLSKLAMCQKEAKMRKYVLDLLARFTFMTCAIFVLAGCFLDRSHAAMKNFTMIGIIAVLQYVLSSLFIRYWIPSGNLGPVFAVAN